MRRVAAGYPRKVDFKRAQYGAYQAMCRRFPHLIDELFENRPSKYTAEKLRSIAAKYPSRKSFERNERGAHCAILNFFPGMLDEIFKRKTNPPGYWTFENVMTEAVRYKTKEDFYRGSLSAYAAAVKHGWLNYFGFEDGATSDNDVVYIWKAHGIKFNGKSVYKIGTTSHRLGMTRINNVSRRSSLDVEVICLKKVSGKATQIEKELLKLGDNPKLIGFNGSCEFRALDGVELKLALDIVNSA